ncbi:hypothetical protein VTP01DRAFT_1408 [Rhizomucor pusillus]|uniref:uncharacterized protein n=1 Tax=Rhizomucor pusillus TaxID=4840 RepID=UPI003744A28B
MSILHPVIWLAVPAEAPSGILFEVSAYCGTCGMHIVIAIFGFHTPKSIGQRLSGNGRANFSTSGSFQHIGQGIHAKRISALPDEDIENNEPTIHCPSFLQLSTIHNGNGFAIVNSHSRPALFGSNVERPHHTQRRLLRLRTESIEMTRKFMDILIVDAIYKSLKNSMPYASMMSIGIVSIKAPNSFTVTGA